MLAGLIVGVALSLALPALSAVSMQSGSGNRSISGTVRSADGPVQGLCAVAWPYYETAPTWFHRMGTSITDAQGRFSIERLPAERYIIRFMECPNPEDDWRDPQYYIDHVPDYPGTRVIAEYWRDQPSWALAEEIDVRTGDVSRLEAVVELIRGCC
jgi:hypothetical protein